MSISGEQIMNEAKETAAASETARFELLEEEQVLDRRTGLIWTRADVPGGPMDWKAAQAACAALELGGVRTWRLPTVEELFCLADRARYSPAIDPVFECASDFYWTSTPAAYSPGVYAWVVGFLAGDSFWRHQSYDYPVRAVRSSQ
jgi:hypothetical protein